MQTLFENWKTYLAEDKEDPSYAQETYNAYVLLALSSERGGNRDEIKNDIRAIPEVLTVSPVERVEGGIQKQLSDHFLSTMKLRVRLPRGIERDILTQQIVNDINIMRGVVVRRHTSEHGTEVREEQDYQKSPARLASLKQGWNRLTQHGPNDSGPYARVEDEPEWKSAPPGAPGGLEESKPLTYDEIRAELGLVPVPEPTPEPVPEPAPVAAPEPASEPVPEPAPVAAPEPPSAEEGPPGWLDKAIKIGRDIITPGPSTLGGGTLTGPPKSPGGPVPSRDDAPLPRTPISQIDDDDPWWYHWDEEPLDRDASMRRAKGYAAAGEPLPELPVVYGKPIGIPRVSIPENPKWASHQGTWSGGDSIDTVDVPDHLRDRWSSNIDKTLLAPVRGAARFKSPIDPERALARPVKDEHGTHRVDADGKKMYKTTTAPHRGEDWAPELNAGNKSGKYGKYKPIEYDRKAHPGKENEWREDPLEMIAPANLQVLQMRSGVSGYGNQILFRYLDDNKQWVRRTFNHLEELPDYIKPGQFVRAGERFGRMGNSGTGTGIHLHDEMWKESAAEKDFLDRYPDRAEKYRHHHEHAGAVYSMRLKQMTSEAAAYALRVRKTLRAITKNTPVEDRFDAREAVINKLKKDKLAYKMFANEENTDGNLSWRAKQKPWEKDLSPGALALFNSRASPEAIRDMSTPPKLNRIAGGKNMPGGSAWLASALSSKAGQERRAAALAAAEAEDRALAGLAPAPEIQENKRRTFREGCASPSTRKIKIKIRPRHGELITSFEVQPNLNPTVWEGEVLRPAIRERLQEIAVEFIEKLDLPNASIKDIILTGSLANYNWSEYSDLDVHIVIDFKDIANDEGLVKKYFDAVRANWNRNHDIKVKGFEVELYVQDDDEVHESTGIYSLLQDEWVLTPSPIHATIDKTNIFKKARHIMRDIDKVERYLQHGDYEGAVALGQRTKDKIKKMRRTGLHRGGVYSTENLAFKVLRRGGYMGKLLDAVGSAYDAQRSLAEQE
jgi:predicted nucleotidyltransferase